MRDLEIRGAGNLLGDEQSGHVAAIGFEMYAQLLDEAVAELRDEPPPVAADRARRDPGHAYVPPEYVALRGDQDRRPQAHLVGDDHGGLAEARAELTDRFGPPPEPVDNAAPPAGECASRRRSWARRPSSCAAVGCRSRASSSTTRGRRALRAADERVVYFKQRATLSAHAAPGDPSPARVGRGACSML